MHAAESVPPTEVGNSGAGLGSSLTYGRGVQGSGEGTQLSWNLLMARIPLR